MTIYSRRVDYCLKGDPGTVATYTIPKEMKLGHTELSEVLVMRNLRGIGYKVIREVA